MTKKWKYLKGSEGDFAGYPESIMVVKSCSSGEIFYLSDLFLGKDKAIEACGDTIIAQRQLITYEEQDLNECIGQHQCSESETKQRPASEIDITKFLPDGYPNHEQYRFPCKQVDVVVGGSTEALIAQRGNRYGKFKDGAEIMRDLKYTMHNVDGWNDLSPSQKEALDMIQHKIGRILNGDPNYDDNWKDVAGYATLIVNELNGEIK